MQKIKRILGAIVLVISVLMLVLSLGGILGTWIVRPQFTSGLESLATEAETRVTTVVDGLDRLDLALTEARDQVVGVEQDLQNFGSDVEQNKPLATAISERLASKFGPLFEGTRAIMTTISDAVASANSAVETINAIPFVSVPVPELERIVQLSQDLEDLETQVQDLQTNIDQRRSEIIQGSLSIITTPTSRIITTLDDAQTRVSGISRELGAVQTGLSNFQMAIGRWLTWVAVGNTLILLWVALSQVGVFVLGWRFYSGQDLLAQKTQDAPAEVQSG